MLHNASLALNYHPDVHTRGDQLKDHRHYYGLIKAVETTPGQKLSALTAACSKRSALTLPKATTQIWMGQAAVKNIARLKP